MENKKRLNLVITELTNVRKHVKKSSYWVKEIDFLGEDTIDWYKKETENLLVDTQDLMDRIKFIYNSENPDKPKPKVII